MVKLFWRYRVLRTQSQALPCGRDHIGRISMLCNAEAEGLLLLWIPASGKPDIAGEYNRIDRAVLRIVHIGQRTDSLLILKDGNAGERLGFAAHAKAGDNRPRTSTAKRFGSRPFDESIRENDSAISAQKEVDDKFPKSWLVGNFRRPESPGVPGREPQVRDDLIGGLNVFRGLIQLGKEPIAERCESRIAQ